MANLQPHALTFNPAAWLAKAEGLYRYSVYLWDSRCDGRLRLCIADAEDGPMPEDHIDLWRELRPNDEQRKVNEAALRAHLMAIGRVGEDPKQWSGAAEKAEAR